MPEIKNITRILLLASLMSCAGAAPPLAAVDLPARLPGALEPLIAAYPAPTMEALATLKRGIDNYLKDQHALSLEELAAIAPGATGLDDYVMLYRARAKMMLDRNDDALADFQGLEKLFPDSPLARDACLGKCQALLRLHRAGEALAVLQNEKLEQDSEFLYYRARALEDSGNTAAAINLYLQIYSEDVISKTSSLAEQHLVSMSPRFLAAGKNRGPLLTRAKNLLLAGRYREARALLLKLARNPSSSPEIQERQSLLLGEEEYHLGKASAALTHLKKVRNPEFQPEALYYQASCQRRLKAEERFLKLRDQALQLYPRSPFTERVLYSVATYYDVDDRTNEARSAYQAIIAGFPEGAYTERAHWKLAFYDYVAGDYEKALEGFYGYIQAYPNPSRAAGASFWMGRCYAKLGDHAAAVQLFRRVTALANNSYYGQRGRAAESSLADAGTGRPFQGLELKKVLASLEGLRPPQFPITDPAGAAVRVIERVRRLAAANLQNLALSELRWAIRNYPRERGLSYAIARIWAIQGDYFDSFTALRRAFPNYGALPLESLPQEVWALLYPLQHKEIVTAEAAKRQLDPDLILGLIRQESAFNETAISSSNARGLMQVLPSTGRILARQAGIRPYSTALLFQAGTNIALGSRYLASLLERFNQNEELALAAYNAGDNRVVRWVAQFGNQDMAEFVERIPFSETRDYIKQVLTNRALYGILKTSSANR